MMMTKDLFFIADISGFTEFVKSTEQNHSKHIIRELLEIIIKSNKIGFTLVEIEGDAIFFYGKRGTFSASDLLKQIEQSYLQFKDHLQLYESKRICPCGACTNASKLSLKFISHFGELDFIEVGGSRKPYGKDVILTHRLLKNSVNSNTYMLFSGTSENQLISNEKKLEWKSESSFYDNEDVNYIFRELNYLDGQVKMYRQESYKGNDSFNLTSSVKVNCNPEKLLELISNFNLRFSWNKSAYSIIYDEKRINRSGEKHVFVIDNKHINFKTITSDFGEGKLVYGEVTNNAAPIDELVQFFVISETDTGSLLETYVYFELKNIFKKLLYPLIKIKLTKIVSKTLQNIKLSAEIN